MTRVNVFKLEKRMVLAMVNYSKATKEGAMLNYHTPGGLRTVGSDGLKHELLDADIVDRLEVASRLDTESLSSGDQTYPEGTDDEVFNLLVGLKPPSLPGHPRFMDTRQCAEFLQKYLLFSARQKVCN